MNYMSRREFLNRGIVGMMCAVLLLITSCGGGEEENGEEENGEEENGEEEDDGGGY